MIGDAPPNTKEEVRSKRQAVEYNWSETPFAVETYWEDEVALLKQKDIPVHTFFVAQTVGIPSRAETVFRDIAARTAKAGTAPNICEFLDTSSNGGGAERLKNLISERVAYDVGVNSGIGGDLLVDALKRLQGEGNL